VEQSSRNIAHGAGPAAQPHAASGSQLVDPLSRGLSLKHAWEVSEQLGVIPRRRGGEVADIGEKRGKAFHHKRFKRPPVHCEVGKIPALERRLAVKATATAPTSL